MFNSFKSDKIVSLSFNPELKLTSSEIKIFDHWPRHAHNAAFDLQIDDVFGTAEGARKRTKTLL